MSYSKEQIRKSKDTLNYLKHNLKRLMKLKSKVYKINRNCYGINREIEDMIHIGREHLSQGFIWLDKAYYKLKKNIKEKEDHNKKLEDKGYIIK